MVHNIELYPGKGGQLVRSAGNGAQLMAKEGKYATLRLPSGEMRMVPIICRATVGVVGNAEHNLINIGKAGTKTSHGYQTDSPWFRNEPERPSAWWWRRKDWYRTSGSLHTVGQTCSWPEDQKEKQEV